MLKQFSFIVIFLLSSWAFSQEKNVGINTNTPDPSAVLHLESDDQGLLVPRLSTSQRDAIATPATGLIIYNTDENQEEIYNGTCWIPSYLKECDDCQLDINFQQASYTLNRANALNLSIPVDIVQTTFNGATVDANYTLVHTFTQESTVELDQYTLNGSGTLNISLQTNVFERGGTHSITIFGTCGANATSKTIQLDISLCDEVTISSDQTNYDLSANGVDGSNCVVVTINENTEIRSSDSNNPAFTTGSVNTNCNIGIINQGLVFGKGANAPNLMGQDGVKGGDAFEINCNAEFRNKGMIYAGGGSGTTVGAFESVDLGPFQLCFAIGAGGGGGMPDGQGGGDVAGTCTFTVGPWNAGNDAGSNYDDSEGPAVNENFSQGFSVGPVQGTISITARGGGGGDFGEPGTTSGQPVDFGGTNLEICINIPFIGDICIPVPGFSSALNAISNAIVNAVAGTSGGPEGFAIKHGTGTISIPDGNYQSYKIRGLVGN